MSYCKRTLTSLPAKKSLSISAYHLKISAEKCCLPHHEPAGAGMQQNASLVWKVSIFTASFWSHTELFFSLQESHNQLHVFYKYQITHNSLKNETIDPRGEIKYDTTIMHVVNIGLLENADRYRITTMTDINCACCWYRFLLMVRYGNLNGLR